VAPFTTARPRLFARERPIKFIYQQPIIIDETYLVEYQSTIINQRLMARRKFMSLTA
jgi:hypothetical protein